MIRKRKFSGRSALLLFAAVVTISISFFWVEPRSVRDDFEVGGLLESVWQVDAAEDCNIEVSNLNARNGARSIMIVAPRGKRCELVPRIYPELIDKFFREPTNESRWYSFSTFVTDLGDISTDEDLGKNAVVAQWHSSPDPFIGEAPYRGPPLALRIHNGEWVITYGWDKSFRSTNNNLASNWQRLGSVDLNLWADWKFHVVWSYGENGLVEIWQGDALVFSRIGPNTYNDVRGVYLKLGLYHPVNNSTIFLDRISVLNTRS